MKFKKVCSVVSVPFLVASFINFDYVAAYKGKLNAECLVKVFEQLPAHDKINLWFAVKKRVCKKLSIHDEMKLYRAVQENICYLNDKGFVLNLPENIKWRMLTDDFAINLFKEIFLPRASKVY